MSEPTIGTLFLQSDFKLPRSESNQNLHVDIDCLQYDVWLEGHREKHICGECVLECDFQK